MPWALRNWFVIRLAMLAGLVVILSTSTLSGAGVVAVRVIYFLLVVGFLAWRVRRRDALRREAD
jgi:hypothetical protein